jgi:hypothetical protein
MKAFRDMKIACPIKDEQSTKRPTKVICSKIVSSHLILTSSSKRHLLSYKQRAKTPMYGSICSVTEVPFELLCGEFTAIKRTEQNSTVPLFVLYHHQKPRNNSKDTERETLQMT